MSILRVRVRFRLRPPWCRVCMFSPIGSQQAQGVPRLLPQDSINVWAFVRMRCILKKVIVYDIKSSDFCCHPIYSRTGTIDKKQKDRMWVAGDCVVPHPKLCHAPPSTKQFWKEIVRPGTQSVLWQPPWTPLSLSPHFHLGEKGEGEQREGLILFKVVLTLKDFHLIFFRSWGKKQARGGKAWGGGIITSHSCCVWLVSSALALGRTTKQNLWVR